MSLWFRYERNNGSWCPAVYHLEKPKTPKGDEERFTTAVPVPDDCVGPDGAPMFSALQKRFPKPETEA